MVRLSDIAAAGLLSYICLAAADIPAPPAIVPGGIVNTASRLPASLRGGAIARGARITIPGVRLGPETGVPGSESDPPVLLSDVSVRIRQDASAIDAGLLFVSVTRIDAWLPDSSPLGTVFLTVTYQGRTSEPYELIVVRSSVGLFSSEPPPSVLPGETLRLRSTGLNENTLAMFVGGKPASAVRVPDGLSCCMGVQQIAIQVPPDAPLGCFVPVQARSTEGNPSNVIPVAVHLPGQPCHDEIDWFRDSVEHASRAGFLVLSHISMVPGHVPASGDFKFDYGIGSFGRQESGQRPFPPLPPANTCTVFASRINMRQIVRQSRTPSEWTSIPEKTPGNRRLDAGVELTVAGPVGTQKLNRDPRQRDYYNAILGGHVPLSHDPATPLFLRTGRYVVSSAGGADVGPFSVTLEVPGDVVWKNRAKIEEVNRNSGVTVEWKAARKDDAVLIMATNADPDSGDAAVCLCMAPARQGHFTIPPVSLGNVPPTLTDSELSGSYLIVMEIPVQPPARIEAKGLDAAFAAFISVSARRIVYR